MALIKKFKMHLIVAGLMLAEGAMLYFFLPSGGSGINADEAAKKANAKAVDFAECELAAAKLNNTIDPDVSVSVDFKVYAVVYKDREEEFKQQFEKKKFRIKEAIATVMRKANHEWLQEPALTTLKRQLKEAVVEVVGRDKEFVERIVIPEFKTMEL